MTKEKVPQDLLKLLSKEEIIIFKELQRLIRELNKKTNLTRLVDGNDYWISHVYDSVWTFKKQNDGSS